MDLLGSALALSPVGHHRPARTLLVSRGLLRWKEEQMPRATRAVSRKDFLRLSGAGLAGAALLGTTGCGGGQGGGGGIRDPIQTPPKAHPGRKGKKKKNNRVPGP